MKQSSVKVFKEFLRGDKKEKLIAMNISEKYFFSRLVLNLKKNLSRSS